MKTIIASLLALLAVTPQRTLDEFFNDFTARWVRSNPNLAVSSRYTGDERDRLEQQLAPETMEYKKSRIRRGIGIFGGTNHLSHSFGGRSASIPLARSFG